MTATTTSLEPIADPAESALAETPQDTPSKPFSLAQVQALGYTIDDHFAFTQEGVDEEDGTTLPLSMWLIGFVDDQGKAPDFCLLACEGFPQNGRIVPCRFAAMRARLVDAIERGVAIP